MANNDDDMIDEVEVIQEEADTARDFTSGIIFTTTLILLAGIVTMLYGMGEFFNVGPFKDS